MNALPNAQTAIAPTLALTRAGVFALMDSMPGIAIQGHDSQYKVVYWNDASTRLYGYSRAEAMGCDLLTLIIPPAEQESVRAIFAKAMARETLPVTGGGIHCHQDGTPIAIHTSQALARVDAGELLLFSFSVDERPRQRLLDKLAEREALLDSVIRHGSNICFIKNWDGQFLLANQALATLYGTTVEQMTGKSDADFNPNAEQVAFYLENIREIMRSGQSRIVMETSTDVTNGQIRHFQSTKTPFTNAHGQACVLVIANDVTELLQAREAAEQARQSAEDACKRLDYALTTIDEGVWDWDLPSGQVRHNHKWCALLGLDDRYLEHELAVYSNAIHPDDRPQVFAALDSCLKEGIPYRAEYRMLHQNGSEIWVIDRGDVVERDQEGRPLRVVGALLDISQRKQDEEQIRKLVFYDPLTHLANRRRFNERLPQALSRSASSGRHGALLFIDVDHFKTINDTRGHEVGDLLLCQIAQLLCRHSRQQDLVARLGGDEFVVLAENLSCDQTSARHAAQHLGQQLLQAINRDLTLDGMPYNNSISIGGTLFSGNAESHADLLAQADLALYQAKHQGRSRICFFQQALHETASQREQLRQQLHHALSNHEFFLALQPQFNTRQQPIGAEVLLRWRNAKGQQVAPADFIPCAEAYGLILPIGRWVLLESCQLLASWQSRPALSGMVLSVNISARQFQQADFVSDVLAILAETGAPPARLKLELTESVLLDNLGDAEAKMRSLCTHGIRFSMDDFGTGYASLTYLKRLPLSEIKIDQEFVRDIHSDSDDAAIVDAILAMARALKLGVVAEGVETEAQFAYLASGQCDIYQGYLLGRPGSVKTFESLPNRA
ncbi:EAL domain-containing protein [Craterilacuibacter sp. RT1T]|uniref:sensor domain-containing protein n=1 Tax=Craterilacuibacter sp. RT1T TaxID=2942211 RepID=UPI0020C0AB0B|nr:EAL domain-containing protein [Craterilacuibacter sp. RT1T]MCL6262658.1 EAL domain-containing protein [Craterilacuibacter sp. RT1T]